MGTFIASSAGRAPSSEAISMDQRPPKPLLELDLREEGVDANSNPSFVLSDELREQLSEFTKGIAANLEVAQEITAKATERIRESLGPFIRQIVDALPDFVLAFGRFAPKNWGEDPDLERIVDVMIEEGYCLAWVPPEEVVDQMIAATTRADWDDVLTSNSEAIIRSVRSILQECNEPILQECRSSVEEAADAWDNGLSRAAQSLASSCITHIAQNLLGHLELADAKKEWKIADSEELSFAFRLELLGSCLSRVFEKTSENKPGFNRHATAHGVSAGNYTDANALNAIMLAAAWLREFQSEAEYERRRVELKEKRIATGRERSVEQLRMARPIADASNSAAQPTA